MVIMVNYDIFKEPQYLKALNNDLGSLNEKQIIKTDT